MANVVDPNSWRMVPHPESQSSTQSKSTTGAGAAGATPQPAAGHRQLGGSAAIAYLSMALGRTFGSQHDHVVWNLAVDRGGNDGGQYVRVDSRHAERAPAALDAAQAQGAVRSGADRPWLVIVEDARQAVDPERFRPLQATLDSDPQFLLVACNVADADAPASADDTSSRAADFAAKLRCQYVGPVSAGDTGKLVETLEHIKRLGQPTLLHLDARGATAPPAPHFAPPAGPHAPQTDVGRATSPRHVAAQALAELAQSDERIVAVSTDAQAALAAAWQTLPGRLYPIDSGVPYALSWCASLAAGGSRPFAFLSCDEAQDSLGQIRRDIALRREPVTLILETRADDPPGSALLGGIRQLPNVSLLAPKDADELQKMLAWSAGQDDPAVIWLSRPFEPEVTWLPSSDIGLGRSEQLSQGRDVAIVAWGPMAAAATMAADTLALSGIEATVVNTRFAQPLDVESIARSILQSTFFVLVDDCDQTGGFAGWVLEHLQRADVSHPMAIVAPPTSVDRQDPRDLQNQCALEIAQRCRWLAEPILPSVTVKTPPPASEEESRTLAGNWQRFIGRNAERTARERAQVYARELSYDVRRWVSAYEAVGSRDVYLWKWCSHGVELTTLPGVVPELRAHVCDTKLLSIVLCVLLDDVADQHGNSYLLDALLEMTCWGSPRTEQGLNRGEQRHAETARALWEEYLQRIKDYPAYQSYEPVLRFDLLQSFNTMRYSHLVNDRPYLLNMVEHDLYTPHNMMQTSFATLDLMCAPDFPLAEVGPLREAVSHAQCMGRIGNLLTTWRRELANRDFTSGVFARAMMEGDLTLAELEHGDVGELEARIRAHGHEAYFFGKWLEHRKCCHALVSRITWLDARAMLEAHDRFFALYLGSRGLL